MIGRWAVGLPGQPFREPRDSVRTAVPNSGMDGEPVDLLHQYGHRLVRRWKHPGDGPWDIVHAHLYELADGRWCIDRTDRRHAARAYPDQVSAKAAADRLMADRHTGWVEQPTDGKKP